MSETMAELEAALALALNKNRWTAVQSWIGDLYALDEMDVGDLPGEFVTRVVDLLRKSKLLQSPHSSKLLYGVTIIWEFLSEHHQRLALNALSDAFPLLRDKVSWFIVCEIVGEKTAGRGRYWTASRARGFQCRRVGGARRSRF